MKKSDINWVQGLARRACGKPRRAIDSSQTLLQAVTLFLDELCMCMTEYSQYFNELVIEDRPDCVFRVFRFGNPRPGLMLLRGRDKLIISGEGPKIRARIVQVHAYQERSLDVLDFEATVIASGEIIWVCTNDNQKVNPELVARYYLSPFLENGSKAFEPRFAGYHHSSIVRMDA